jgi:hypothetical protein
MFIAERPGPPGIPLERPGWSTRALAQLIFGTVWDCIIRPAGPKEAVLGPFGAGFRPRMQFLAHRRVVTAALAHRETQEPRQGRWLCLVILEDSQHEHRDSATPEALPPAPRLTRARSAPSSPQPSVVLRARRSESDRPAHASGSGSRLGRLTTHTVHLCTRGTWVGFSGSLERLRGGNRPNTRRWVGIRARLGAQLAP